MAVYHLRLKLISRGGLGGKAKAAGATRRSVVASAAYRSGEKLWCDYEGRFYAYSKPDVVHTEILAPEGAAPFVYDRQALWNIVERSEKRHDAQLAREVELTLPRELDRRRQIELVRSFVRDTFVSHGMVADIAIHEPVAADGRVQPHCHCLLTLRELDAASVTGFAALKNRDWNEPEPVAQAVADARKRFNDTGLEVDKSALDEAEKLRNVNVWRASWADYANRALADSGSAARIDHRTLEAQGILRPAQPNLGIVRHIENAYAHLKDRLTQWVAVKKRAALYSEVEQLARRDPVALAEFVLRLGDMAESFAAQFRRSPSTPEPSHER